MGRLQGGSRERQRSVRRMPRITPALLRRAYSIQPYLASLLSVCRDLRSARNELRWLREHARKNSSPLSDADDKQRLLHSYVKRRARAEPLQYILGTEYFGDLEIKCRPDVLIPRQETAASVTHLVNLLCETKTHPTLPMTLRVLDLCTGSGCIPLLLHHALYSMPGSTKTRLDITGVDISSRALSLARENVCVQQTLQSKLYSPNNVRMQSLSSVSILWADVLIDDHSSSGAGAPSLSEAMQRRGDYAGSMDVDILISNPPYLSAKAFRTTTPRSVRAFEPRLALVPDRCLDVDPRTDNDGDLFYPHLLRHAQQLNAKTILFEVADMDQAKRVASLIIQQGNWIGVEIWRDDPAAQSGGPDQVEVESNAVPIMGEGHGRSVFAYRDDSRRWLRNS